MKTKKASALLWGAVLGAALLGIACKNEFTGSEANPDYGVFTKQASGGIVKITNPSDISTSGTIYNTTNQTITLTFNGGVATLDAAVIKSAVTLAYLTNAASDAALLGETSLPFTVTVVGNVAYLLTNLTASSAGVQVKIDGAQFSALDGNSNLVKLDVDGDGRYGESGDDDVYKYMSVNAYNAAIITPVNLGVLRGDLQQTYQLAGQNPANGLTALTQSNGVYSTRWGWQLDLSSNLLDYSVQGRGGSTTYVYDDTDYGTVFASKIKVEKADKNGNWADVAKTVAYVKPTFTATGGLTSATSDGASTNGIPATFKTGTLTIALNTPASDGVYRVRFTSLDSISQPAISVLGKPLAAYNKSSLFGSSNGTTESVRQFVVNYPTTSQNRRVPADTAFSTKSWDSASAKFTLTPNGGYTQLDVSTLKAAGNVKILEDNGTWRLLGAPVGIDVIYANNQPVGTLPVAQIIVSFPESAKTASSVAVAFSPDVVVVQDDTTTVGTSELTKIGVSSATGDEYGASLKTWSVINN
jgi:hypothetical protein